MSKADRSYAVLWLAGTLLASACAAASASSGTARAPVTPTSPARARSEASCPAEPIALAQARSLVDTYCVSCHSPSGAAGEDYDFRSDSAITVRRRGIEAKLRLHVMPPPNAAQPSAVERARLRCWAKG